MAQREVPVSRMGWSQMVRVSCGMVYEEWKHGLSVVDVRDGRVVVMCVGDGRIVGRGASCAVVWKMSRMSWWV
jgi:uncharacterized protein (DUF779 family)